MFLPILLLLFLFLAPHASATVSSCTANVSPSSVNTTLNSSFRFDITNPTSSDINWMKITRPSTNFTLTSFSSPGIWNGSLTDSDLTLTGGPLSPQVGSVAIFINATAGSSESPPANWTIEVSDDPGGANPTTCTGSQSTGISGIGVPTPTPVGPPAMSNLNLSGLSDTQVVISWTTDQSSDTSVQYGPDSNYGLSADGASSTSHSVTITGLTANSTYHYLASSSNSNGSVDSGDQTFTTAAAGTTTTQTITQTITQTTTQTITQKSEIPSISLSFDSTKIYNHAPTITGQSSDIQSADYSVDSGVNWLPVDSFTANSFSFTPHFAKSALFHLKIRVANSSGNFGYSPIINLNYDSTPPAIKITTDLSKSFTVAPTIIGTVNDSAGISSIYYSLNSGKSWFIVDNLTSTGFSFTPQIIDDDNYPIQIKATDNPGNITVYTAPQPLVIDRLPPLVCTALITVGPLVLTPDDTGLVNLVPNLTTQITVSAIGGPTTITLGDAKLTKNADSGLWSDKFTFLTPGKKTLTANAVDGAQNNTSRDLISLNIIPPGKITGPPQASLTVFTKPANTTGFKVWDARPYLQSNPQSTQQNSYSLLLPPGTYYLKISAPGYVTQQTSIFTLTSSQLITQSFELRPQHYFLKIPLIWFPDSINFSNKPLNSSTAPNSLIGQPLPNLPLLAPASGKSLDLIFLSTWSPSTFAQLSLLPATSNYLVYFSPEQSDSLSIFQQRGAYKINFIADPDGTLVTPLNLTTSPTHIFVNHRGIITRVRNGVLDFQNILDSITN